MLSAVLILIILAAIGLTVVYMVFFNEQDNAPAKAISAKSEEDVIKSTENVRKEAKKDILDAAGPA